MPLTPTELDQIETAFKMATKYTINDNVYISRDSVLTLLGNYTSKADPTTLGELLAPKHYCCSKTPTPDPSQPGVIVGILTCNLSPHGLCEYDVADSACDSCVHCGERA